MTWSTCQKKKNVWHYHILYIDSLVLDLYTLGVAIYKLPIPWYLSAQGKFVVLGFKRKSQKYTVPFLQ